MKNHGHVHVLHLPVAEVRVRIVHAAVLLVWILEEHSGGSAVIGVAELNENPLSSNGVRGSRKYQR